MNYNSLFSFAADFERLVAPGEFENPANDNRLNYGKIELFFIDLDTGLELHRHGAHLLNFNLAPQIAKRIIDKTLEDNNWDQVEGFTWLEKPELLMGKIYVRNSPEI